MRTSSNKLGFSFVAVALLCACGGDRPSAPEVGGSKETPLVTIDPATTGRIAGKISYSGPDPAPYSVDISGDPNCAKEQPEATYTAEVVVGADHALANAVVWVKAGAPEGRYPVPDRKGLLEQKGCAYAPRVQALQLGQALEIRNADPTMHNVHVVAQANREWNRSQIEGGVPIVETFTREEIPVTFKCNVHPWMKAQVAVIRNPFFAVTAQDGRFQIAGLPAGEYTIAVWHETLGTVERRISVVAQDAATADFTLPAGG